MIAVFAAIVLPHMLLSALGKREIVPPRFLGIIGWLAGLRVRTEGCPAAGTLLLLPNHVSWLDILALAGTSRAAFVAHGGLTGHRFLKWLCDQNDTVFVTRERRGTVNRQVEQVREALREQPLAIFLEGTTGDGTRLLPFKSALLSAVEGAPDDAAIQPVALAYEGAAEIAWFGAEPGMNNVRRILSRTRPIRLTVRFLEPLAGPQLADRKAMAQAAQETVARSLAL
jgi:1-acyl-sn-glycerol-3-phosphate acyltransferase